MKSALSLVVRSIVAIMPLTFSSVAVVAQTASVTIVSDFGQTPRDATGPTSPLVFDKAGNLYGVSAFGGAFDYGSFFEITKKPDGVWTRRDLHNFTGGADGGGPVGPLILDAASNLYGVTANGGENSGGTVFEFSPSGDGIWAETVLYSFGGHEDGGIPLGGIIFDTAGNLYGTTKYGGVYSYGTIFKLAPQEGGGWKESVIHSFHAVDGPPSYGALAIDKKGNLYGTTIWGLAGVVFELSPESSGEWNYTVLHTFPSWNASSYSPNDGDYPFSGVVLDANGNLYGTTVYGGTYNDGTVFEIPVGQGPNGPDKILYNFHSVDHGGTNPEAGLVFDHSGNLYGATYDGGVYGGGKAFEMLPDGDGTWTIKDLHDFGGQKYNGFSSIDGTSPSASMILGSDGNLYGVTVDGGYYPKYPNGYGGTAFELVLPH